MSDSNLPVREPGAIEVLPKDGDRLALTDKSGQSTTLIGHITNVQEIGPLLIQSQQTPEKEKTKRHWGTLALIVIGIGAMWFLPRFRGPSLRLLA